MPNVAKKNNDAEREFEAKIVREAIQKDREAEARERREKDAARMRDINLITELEEQVKQKEKAKQLELQQNQKYIQMVLQQDERDKQN